MPAAELEGIFGRPADYTDPHLITWHAGRNEAWVFVDNGVVAGKNFAVTDATAIERLIYRIMGWPVVETVTL